MAWVWYWAAAINNLYYWPKYVCKKNGETKIVHDIEEVRFFEENGWKCEGCWGGLDVCESG